MQRWLLSVSAAALTVVAGAQMVDPSAEEVVELDPFLTEGYGIDYQEMTGSTATRLSVPIREIPISLSVLNQQALEDQAILRESEIARNIANAHPLGSNFNIRGYYNFTYRDGVFQGLLSGAHPSVGSSPPQNMFEIQSVEILKGPGSILFGRGEPGGTINFITKKPFQAPANVIQATFDNHGLWRADLDVNRPLNDAWGIRLVTSYEDAEFYRDDLDHQATYITPSVRYQAGGWEVNAYYAYSQIDAAVDSNLLMIPRPLNFSSWEQFVGLGEAAELTWDLLPGQEIDDFYGDPAGFRDAESHRGRVELKREVSEALTLRAEIFTETLDETNHSRFFAEYLYDNFSPFFGLDYDLVGFDVSGFYTTGFQQVAAERDDLTLRLDAIFNGSHELGDVVVSHRGLVSYERFELDFMTDAVIDSVSLFDPRTKTNTLNPLLPAGTSFTSLTTGETVTDALALQNHMSLGDRWNVLVGLRYEEYENTQTENDLGTGFTDVTTDSEDSQLIPRLGVMFSATENVGLFANYMESFMTPALGQQARDGALSSVTGQSFELGAKAQVLEGRVTLGASIFDTQKKDVILLDGIDPTTGTPFFINAGEESSRGMEFELSGMVTDRFRMLAAFGVQDFEFEETNVPGLEGKSRAGVPESTASLWGVYDLADILPGVEIGGGLFYRDEVFVNNQNEATFDNLITFDALVAYETKGFRFSLNVKNIFDEEGYEPLSLTGASPFEVSFIQAQPPRTFLFTGSYRF